MDKVTNQGLTPIRNLPPDQRSLQRLVDQFNADESLWRSLEAKRLLQRTRNLGLSRVHREILDFLDWVGKRHLAECIGYFDRP